jgi:hypothetical protein
MRQILPVPRTTRELIELFAVYERERGIASVVSAADFTVLDRPTVLRLVFGTLSARRLAKPAPDDYRPRAHLRSLLQGAEFRERARPLILEAFPEKRRTIFVHVPKCAGSDMTRLLSWRYPLLHQGYFAVGKADPEIFFERLRNFALGVRYSDTIAMAGHERLAYYHDKQHLVRPTDWLFTTVREPTSLVYSGVSYILTICRTAPATGREDGLAWLAQLGLSAIPEDASPAYLADLGRRVLHDPAITAANPICSFLGDGTAESALRRIVDTNIEITDTTRYNAWRNIAFPGAAATHSNVSQPFFTEAHAEPRDREYVAHITAEDRILYPLIKARLEKTGTLSIRGAELG